MKKLSLILSLLVLSVAWVHAQRSIMGQVTDNAGEPLIGTSIIAKGTSAGTTTDIDGSFTLQVPKEATVLVFSYTGYETQEVTLGTSNTVNVVLADAALGLDEIVVVGYGTQQKRDVTGSISSVKGETISGLATPSFDQQLAGRAAGVQITTPSGILGAAPQIRIRGVNSITSGTEPLIVIDGVPALSGDRGTYTAANALADINPADIQSFEVLKDGAATAIYGSRAANGVILITTKRGQSGKAKFAYDAYVGSSQAVKLHDLLGAEDFVTISNEKNRNAGGATDIAALQTIDGKVVETNWNDVMYRTALQHSHNFSVTGGTDKGSYFFSLGFADQEGIAVANSLRRYTFRGNLDQKVSKRISVGFNSSVARTENYGPLTGSNNLSGNTFGAVRMFPNVNVYDETHPTGYNIDAQNPRTLGRGANTAEIANGIPNARFVLDNDVRSAQTWRMFGNTYLNVNIAKGLDFRTQLGIDGSFVESTLFQDPRHGDGFSANGRLNQRYAPRTRWNWQNILTYKQTFGTAHNLDLTAVQEYQKDRTTFYEASVSDLSDRFFSNNIVSGSFANQVITGNINELGLASYLGRVNYNYDRRYYIGASIRRDALSSLPIDGRVGYFPGASFAWRVSQESFWGGGLAKVISDFRIRGSYAEVGNTDIGFYPYVGSYGAAQYGSQNGIGYNNFGNDQLRWEAQQKLDFGFDMGLFDNRINLAFAYWAQDNADIILEAPTAPSLGVPSNFINQNIGRIKGNGIELTLDATVVNSGNFRWNTSINFSTQNNEVVELVKGADILDVDNFNITRVGEAVKSLYGYDYFGVNPANGNPVYVKANGVLVENDLGNGAFYEFDPANPGTRGATSSLSATADRRILGSALPTWFGGFDNNFSYKNFDVNVFFRFSGGNMIFNRTRADLLDMGFNNNGTEILGRWQSPENPGDGMTPKMILNQTNRVNNPAVATTRFLEKGDFLRLGNVSLGYTVPKAKMESLGLSNLRFYVQGQNLLTITGYKGLDPETNTNGFGVDWNGNPQQRVVSFGLNLGF